MTLKFTAADYEAAALAQQLDADSSIAHGHVRPEAERLAVMLRQAAAQCRKVTELRARVDKLTPGMPSPVWKEGFGIAVQTIRALMNQLDLRAEP